MKLTTVFTRSVLAAITVLNVSVASQALAEPITVQRGSHGGSLIVDSDNIPVDATRQVGRSGRSKAVIQRGPRGAYQVGRKSAQRSAHRSSGQRLITRGPNGAGFITNK